MSERRGEDYLSEDGSMEKSLVWPPIYDAKLGSPFPEKCKLTTVSVARDAA
jgi:hypothetical protein